VESQSRAGRERARTRTFGNVSGIDRDAGVVLIKPSGVPYEEMTPGHMVAVALDTGAVIDGTLQAVV